ncbi:MAG: alpha/beta hydrolase [Porticoccaceae bacterium]|nr:alpha/beta hydrolase [Porticoccaceae bacterium]
MSQQQLDKILKIFEKQNAPSNSGKPPSLKRSREVLDDNGAKFKVPADVTLEPVSADGVEAEFLTAPGADPQKAVLYLHGGGYAIGSIKSHRYLMQNVSRASGARTLGINYALAPENPFPAAIEDSAKAYRWLLKQGFKPQNIAIAGDSAGGGLTLATLLYLRDAGDPLPAAGVGISPWTDMTCSAESYTTRVEIDPMVLGNGLEKMADFYVGDADKKDPLASPVFADMTGMPPLLIHVGGREVLYDDAITVYENAKKAGVDVELLDEPEMFHVWHAFAPMLEEAQDAVDKIGVYLRGKMG